MKKPAQIILFRILGFLLFLILLAIGNIVIPFVNNSFYTSIIIFLNSNIILLLILTFIGIINELFWNFNFPYNILAPITGGALAVYFIMFFYQVWIFVEAYLNLNIAIPITSLYILIFLLVVVIGYIVILSKHGRTREEKEEKLKGRHDEMEKRKKHERNVEWEDVEKEFRLIFYNIGKGINTMFNGNHKKTGNRKRKRRR